PRSPPLLPYTTLFRSDPARAKSSPFGGTIAHGFLTLSLLSHLSEATFSFSDRKMGINYGLNRVRFTSPVPVGSRVRARFMVLKLDRKSTRLNSSHQII